jgi:DNA polymerase-4
MRKCENAKMRKCVEGWASGWFYASTHQRISRINASAASTHQPHQRINSFTVWRNSSMNWYIAIYISDFPAQAYAAYHPEMAGVPYVIVRQRADSHKSVVASLSPEAQSRGIYHGFPIARLTERFRDIHIVQEDPALAAAITDDIATVLSAYSPDVRVSSRGSAVVNVSGMQRLLKARFYSLADEISVTITSTLAIRYCSCGAGASPYVASMAARAAAPDGITVCEKGAEAAMLAPVAASALPGLSDAIKKRLAVYNIRTVADIQKLSEDFLKSRFDEEGSRLYAMAQGVFFETKPLSDLADVESGHTLVRDENDGTALKSHIRYIVDKLVFKLRTVHTQAGSVAFTVRYSDNKTTQRSMRLMSPTSDFALLYNCCCLLFEQAYTRRIAVRKLSVTAKPFLERECQLDLFDNTVQIKQENIGRSIGEIRMRMGFGVVKNGNSIG